MKHAALRTPILRIYLEGPMLETARTGSFNFMNVLRQTVEGAGWQVEWHRTGRLARMTAPLRGGYALFHMETPTHARALTFRRAYYYPFWQIEPLSQRWQFEVAQSAYDPHSIDPQAARDFADRLRARILPGPQPLRGDAILVPLQGQIRRLRSFQSMSPVRMLAEVAATGHPTVATLHPRETLSYDFPRLLCDKGAAAWHGIYAGQRRGSDRGKPGASPPRRSVIAPVFSSVLNGYPGSGPG
ncbi:hypothetical protein [Paracoccus sp. (in: a-proteobacteria)]|uniref:hypothetical protein n=1 Tax=Paracoccus sp. TaxID=267 RepID=UPI002AFF9145|nr:hypothetical protein [Paracoccus sp. (in: a-proteobacteria)]